MVSKEFKLENMAPLLELSFHQRIGTYSCAFSFKMHHRVEDEGKLKVKLSIVCNKFKELGKVPFERHS